jgi:dihydrodipicolinate synthase/N-acetylneuraminate lyase
MSADIFLAGTPLPKLSPTLLPSPPQSMHPAHERIDPSRAALLKRLMPAGAPTLWCPLLTHYAADGTLDKERMRRHLDFLQPVVKGYLIPGSTGDGWQLSDAEIRELLDFAIDEAVERKLHLLIGVLKTSTDDVLRSLDDTMAWLRRRSGAASLEEALVRSAVCGFTVCPPKGREMSQRDIRAALERVLSTGLPISLYQLPQITENEMAPDTVRWLADRHPNFVMLKDTSGADRVASAGFRDVFLVRGAEGDYSKHLAISGGAYDGFLLSTANVFGPQLAQIIDDLQQGRREQADALSARIAQVVGDAFDAAAPLPYGNAFTNANKAIDHFIAHGPQARNVAAPRLHSGHTLPAHVVDVAGTALERRGLMPHHGYLNR